MTKKIFALTFGFRYDDQINISNILKHTDENYDKICDFITLAKTCFSYQGGNVVIKLKNYNIDSLIRIMEATSHKKTLAFLNEVKEQEKQENAFICIMETKQNIEETSIIDALSQE
jgi:hypothetical protein